MRLGANSFAAALARERGSVAVGDGVLAIPLFRGRGRYSVCEDFALISGDDSALADNFWSVDPHGYVRRRGGGQETKLHRAVCKGELADGLVVDHINRDKLDNRRENLRVITQAQNCQNQRSRGGSSEHRGVSLTRDGRWQAHGTLNGRMTHLGFFDIEQEAADAAAAWRKEHMPFSTD